MPAQIFRPPAVHGTIFRPQVPPAVGALVIGGSGGSEPTYIAEPLAAAGIATLSIAYFARPGLPTELRDIPLEYFRTALQTLRTHTDPELPTVVIGISRGSEAALLTAIHFPAIVSGAVLAVPSDRVVGSRPPGGAAWTLDGVPVPLAPLPVEKVDGPVMLIGAGRDRVWPSGRMARSLSERICAAGDPHDHVLLDYPGAGHALGYLTPELPDGLLPPDLSDDDADRRARADVWPRLVGFLKSFEKTP